MAVYLRVSFRAFFKNLFDFCNFTTSRKQIEFDKEIAKLRNWSLRYQRHLLEIYQISYHCLKWV